MQSQNRSNKVAIELCVVQFWSEIILVISNRTRATCSFDFEITHMISDQIALHSVQLPSLLSCAGRIGTNLSLSPEPMIILTCSRDRELWPEPIFWACAEYLFHVLSQSDLQDLTGSLWIADFRCCTKPELSIPAAGQKDGGSGTRMGPIPVADRKDRGLWEQDCPVICLQIMVCSCIVPSKHVLLQIQSCSQSPRVFWSAPRHSSGIIHFKSPRFWDFRFYGAWVPWLKTWCLEIKLMWMLIECLCGTNLF